MVLVTNSKDYKNVETVDGAVESGKEIIAIQTEVPVDAILSVQQLNWNEVIEQGMPHDCRMTIVWYFCCLWGDKCNLYCRIDIVNKAEADLESFII